MVEFGDLNQGEEPFPKGFEKLVDKDEDDSPYLFDSTFELDDPDDEDEDEEEDDDLPLDLEED